jgi:hypothetical protein
VALALSQHAPNGDIRTFPEGTDGFAQALRTPFARIFLSVILWSGVEGYGLEMSRAIIAKYLAPWKFHRRQKQQRLHALRQRDGDNCRRCRRPIRFDLPCGHDKAAVIERMAPPANDDEESLEGLCLCHRRCNADGVDHTREVQERVRRRNEAELFGKARAVRTA